MTTEQLLDYLESIAEPEEFTNEDWAEERVIEINRKKIDALDTNRKQNALAKEKGFINAISHERVMPTLVEKSNDAFIKKLKSALRGKRTLDDIGELTDYQEQADRPFKEQYDNLKDAKDLVAQRIVEVSRTDRSKPENLIKKLRKTAASSFINRQAEPAAWSIIQQRIDELSNET